MSENRKLYQFTATVRLFIPPNWGSALPGGMRLLFTLTAKKIRGLLAGEILYYYLFLLYFSDSFLNGDLPEHKMNRIHSAASSFFFNFSCIHKKM